MNVFSGIWNYWHDIDAQRDLKDIYVHLKDGRSALLDVPSWGEGEPYVRCRWINYSDNNSEKHEDLAVEDVVWATLVGFDERCLIQKKWRYRKYQEEAVEAKFPIAFAFLRTHGLEAWHEFENVIASGRQSLSTPDQNEQKEMADDIAAIMQWDYGISRPQKKRKVDEILEKIREDLEALRSSSCG